MYRIKWDRGSILSFRTLFVKSIWTIFYFRCLRNKDANSLDIVAEDESAGKKVIQRPFQFLFYLFVSQWRKKINVFLMLRSKKRNGGTALNVFMHNRVKNMQASNLNTSRSPLGTLDTNISHNEQMKKKSILSWWKGILWCQRL